jgi:hypothetical protein
VRFITKKTLDPFQDEIEEPEKEKKEQKWTTSLLQSSGLFRPVLGILAVIPIPITRSIEYTYATLNDRFDQFGGTHT